MEIKQETKSLPRNRKCGNCRYFEPAPLWRKGWCRNPRLYDRRANHLVDSSTIDCEQVFRARIYWEPVPSSADAAELPTAYGVPLNTNTSADSGGIVDNSRARVQSDGILRSRVVNNSPVGTKPLPDENLPVITRREKAAAAPGIVAKPSTSRRWLVENIPYYDKIDAPLSRINWMKILPWFVIIMLLLVVLVNVLGPKKDSPALTADPTTGSLTRSISAPANSAGTQTVTGPTIVQTTQAAPVINGKTAVATPTLSSIVPTAIPPAAPTATQRVADTNAKVVGSGGVNMRKDPSTSAPILIKISEGKLVKIRSGDFKTVEGITWWPVSFEGKDGWVASNYLEKVNP